MIGSITEQLLIPDFDPQKLPQFKELEPTTIFLDWPRLQIETPNHHLEFDLGFDLVISNPDNNIVVLTDPGFGDVRLLILPEKRLARLPQGYSWPDLLSLLNDCRSIQRKFGFLIECYRRYRLINWDIQNFSKLACGCSILAKTVELLPWVPNAKLPSWYISEMIGFGLFCGSVPDIIGQSLSRTEQLILKNPTGDYSLEAYLFDSEPSFPAAFILNYFGQRNRVLKEIQQFQQKYFSEAIKHSQKIKIINILRLVYSYSQL